MAFPKFPKSVAVFQFLKDSLSEPEGNASFSRISAGIIIVAVIVWVSYLVFKTNVMPDLAGPTLFLTGGAGATYGTNKIVTAISDNNAANAALAAANPAPPSPAPPAPGIAPAATTVVVTPVTSAPMVPTQVGN